MSRAVVLDAPGEIAVRDRATPIPGPGEVLVRVAWAGICGSDVDLLRGRRPAPFARYPIVPGHEWSGTVEAIGPGVDGGLLERLVVGENIRPCGTCDPCRRGDVPSCEAGYEETGFTIDGAWADHFVVPAELLHPLGADADLRAAAGIEPAACAADAIARAALEPAQRAGVVGGGTIGLLCTQLARAAGVDVVVIDPQAWKAEVAERCGATTLVSPADAALRHRDLDVVFEAAGARGSASLAVTLVRRGGRVVLCGIPPSDDALATLDLVTKNLDLHTVFGATRTGWASAVRAFTAGTLDPGLLVTHERAMAEAAAALDLVATGGPAVGKVLLRP